MDYEVNDEGVFYAAEGYDEGDGEESDPLAVSSDENASDREAREEIFGASIDDLIAETQNKRRKRKKRRLAGASAPKRMRPSEVPPHLAVLMGAATTAYMNQDFNAAEASLARLIQEAPKATAPYRTLGLIHEERGDRRKALDAYMMAAELDKQDRDLWKRNAALWEEEGDLEQAINCLTRALRTSKGNDAEALRARGEFRVRQGEFKKAADSFVKLAKLQPNDVSIVKTIVKVYKDAGDPSKAVPALQTSIEHFQQGVSHRDGESAAKRNGILFELIQLLVEIWFTQKKYSESSALLSRMNARFSSAGCPLTFVQRLLLAICQHRLGSETLASPTFIEFMSSPSMMAKHKTLLWEVAEACRDSGDYSKALKAYNLLSVFSAYAENVQLLLHRATCYKELGNPLGCKTDLQKVLELKPCHVEASIRLSKFYPRVPTERQLLQAKKRRERRQAQVIAARTAELAAIQSRLKLPNPEASASERESTWSSIGYDYLKVEAGTPVISGLATRDAILVPVSHDDVRVALRIIADAETAFSEGQLQMFLSMVGPPLESALNLKTKLHVEDDDGSEEDDGESDDSDDDTDLDLYNVRSKDAHTVVKETAVESENIEKGLDQQTVAEKGDTEHSEENVHADNMTNPSPGIPVGVKFVEEGGSNTPNAPVHLVEKNYNINGVGVAMLRETSEDLFAQLLEQVFQALYDLGRIKDIEQIMSSLFSLAAVRIGPDSPFKLRMQVLLVVSLFATGRFYDGYDKLRSMLIETPDNFQICCLFALAEEHLGVQDNNERFKSFRVLSRLVKKKPKLPILTYITALCSARGINNSHNYTVGKYLRVYSMVPDSPLLCLCIVVQLLYVAQGRRVANRNQVVIYAMAFLDEYRRKRKALAFDKCQIVVELEMQYNAARAMHQLGVAHMAAELYRSVLSSCDENIGRLPPWADLRRDAAHNLAFIYKQSESFELARAVICKYLVF